MFRFGLICIVAIVAIVVRLVVRESLSSYFEKTVKKYFVEVVVEGDIYSMVNCVANSSSSMLKCFISSCFFAKKSFDAVRLSRLAPRRRKTKEDRFVGFTFCDQHHHFRKPTKW